MGLPSYKVLNERIRQAIETGKLADAHHALVRLCFHRLFWLRHQGDPKVTAFLERFSEDQAKSTDKILFRESLQILRMAMKRQPHDIQQPPPR